jgi:hypothetical protein
LQRTSGHPANEWALKFVVQELPATSFILSKLGDKTWEKKSCPAHRPYQKANCHGGHGFYLYYSSI